MHHYRASHDRLPAAATASFLWGLKTGAGSFTDQVALELGQGPEQVEHQAQNPCFLGFSGH